MQDRAHNEPQTGAQVRLAVVLRIMFANFALVVRDPSSHAGYLGELADDTEVSAEVRAVAEFVLRYHANGREEAIALVPKDNTIPIGVPIIVAIPHSVVEKERSGLLVGLMDAKYVDGQRVIEGLRQ